MMRPPTLPPLVPPRVARVIKQPFNKLSARVPLNSALWTELQWIILAKPLGEWGPDLAKPAGLVRIHWRASTSCHGRLACLPCVDIRLDALPAVWAADGCFFQ